MCPETKKKLNFTNNANLEAYDTSYHLKNEIGESSELVALDLSMGMLR
jgi:hypothetical protein